MQAEKCQHYTHHVIACEQQTKTSLHQYRCLLLHWTYIPHTSLGITPVLYNICNLYLSVPGSSVRGSRPFVASATVLWHQHVVATVNGYTVCWQTVKGRFSRWVAAHFDHWTTRVPAHGDGGTGTAMRTGLTYILHVQGRVSTFDSLASTLVENYSENSLMKKYEIYLVIYLVQPYQEESWSGLGPSRH